MHAPTGPRKQGVPPRPRHQGPPHRGGYAQRKAYLEILPSPPLPPIRTHGNPFGFANVPADRAVPLPFDHPLKEELAEVKHVRESRRAYWAQMSIDLPQDMNNPGSYDYQRWKEEERLAEARIEELAGFIALAERGFAVERVESPSVVMPMRESVRGGDDGLPVGVRRGEQLPSLHTVGPDQGMLWRGINSLTWNMREMERAPYQRGLGTLETARTESKVWRRRDARRLDRDSRRRRSQTQQRNSYPRQPGSVVWTNDAKSEAVTKWMSDIGAAAEIDRDKPDVPLFSGSNESGVSTIGGGEMNGSDKYVVDNADRYRHLSPSCRGNQTVWSLEDELHFEEAEAERETERLEIATRLNAENYGTTNTHQAAPVTGEQVEQPLPASDAKLAKSEPAKLETDEKKSINLLAAIMADLESYPPTPSRKSQSPEQAPASLEHLQQPPSNSRPTHDPAQVLAGVVWKTLQARKARQAAAAAEIQNKETSNWVDIDKAAPIEVMDLQDVPNTASNREEIDRMIDDGKEQYKASAAPVPLSGRVLYVGNLSFFATEEQVRDAFYSYQVESIVFPQDLPDYMQAPGYAFVIMSSAAEAESAIADSFELHIDNRLITVRLGTLPKQYLLAYKPPKRAAESARGRTTASIRSPGNGSQQKPMMLKRARSDSRTKNTSSSSVGRFDRQTIQQVEWMLSNPTISLNRLSKLQLQQHEQFVGAQLENIRKYKARRDQGEELHFKKLRLINREEDFSGYKKELEKFEPQG